MMTFSTLNFNSSMILVFVSIWLPLSINFVFCFVTLHFLSFHRLACLAQPAWKLIISQVYGKYIACPKKKTKVFIFSLKNFHHKLPKLFFFSTTLYPLFRSNHISTFSSTPLVTLSFPILQLTPSQPINPRDHPQHSNFSAIHGSRCMFSRVPTLRVHSHKC